MLNLNLNLNLNLQGGVTMSYNSFEEMPVWQKAMDMAVEIFNLTEGLPRKEDYGLHMTTQVLCSLSFRA